MAQLSPVSLEAAASHALPHPRASVMFCIRLSRRQSMRNEEHSLRGLILAKCLFCSTFYRIHGNFHREGPSRGTASRPASSSLSLQACLILTKWICPLGIIRLKFHTTSDEALSIAACLEVDALILAKCNKFFAACLT